MNGFFAKALIGVLFSLQAIPALSADAPTVLVTGANRGLG